MCPALRLYRGRSDGVSAAEDEPERFRGPLTSSAALASYLRRLASPLLLEAHTAEDIRGEVAAAEQTVVLFAPLDSPARATLAALASRDEPLRRRVSFVTVPPGLASHFDLTAAHSAAALARPRSGEG